MNRREAIAALVSLPATATLSVARVEPNDVIVVECDSHLTMDTAARIKAVMETVWPGRKCVVLDKGMRLRIAKETA